LEIVNELTRKPLARSTEKTWTIEKLIDEATKSTN
jgi:hypothetical protein